MRITIELAGVRADILCRHPETAAFFRDYRCEGPADIAIDPTDEDIRRMEARLREQAARDGRPEAALPPWFVERDAIHGRLAEALIDRDVLLVHGSAIVLDGEAYVFMADSGTGKSTHTRLWREHFGRRAWMLNDDKPMLRLAGDGVLACGTPWDGKHHLSRNASAPLRAIVRLTRSAENHVEPLTRAEALAVVLQYGFRPEDADRMRRVLQLGAALVRRTDAFRLGCNMAPDAARAAYEGITGRVERT